MVRDVCQGGQGVALVVGRAGTGKTFALGMARHARQLDGYRLLATAPTGITAVSLEAEGFEEVATCDRVLADLDRGREQLDARSVLVVDEAGMLGSRKLARLLDHAEQARAKVVLVRDDRQLRHRAVGCWVEPTAPEPTRARSKRWRLEPIQEDVAAVPVEVGGAGWCEGATDPPTQRTESLDDNLRDVTSEGGGQDCPSWSTAR